MHQEQPRRQMALSPLRACCPSPQSPCLSVSATLVFVFVCLFHVHRLAASDSVPLPDGLENLVLPGSLHAADPPLAFPLDENTAAHHEHVQRAFPLSPRIRRGALLYSTLQSSQRHSLSPDLFHRDSPRALMRSTDRLYPVESNPIRDRFSFTGNHISHVSDSRADDPHTHLSMSDSLQRTADAPRDSVHEAKQIQSVEQEELRRHPVIEAFHTIIGTSPQSRSLDTDIPSSNEESARTYHPVNELGDRFGEPAAVRATDLNVAADDGANVQRVVENDPLVEHYEKVINTSDDKHLKDDSTRLTATLSSHTDTSESVPTLRDTVAVDASAMSDEAREHGFTIGPQEKSEQVLNSINVPKEKGLLSFLWGSSRSREDPSAVREEENVSLKKVS